MLTKHFDRIAYAKDAIPRLKRFILDLAVRGKLLPQDPHDEPASELLKKIAKEKKKLIAEGKIKKEKPLPDISKEEKPFEVPRGWEWVRVGNLIKLWNGFAFKSEDFQTYGVPVIRIGDLKNGQVDISQNVKVSEEFANKMKPEIFIPEGALLIAMSGATTGKVAINRTEKKILLNQRVGRIEVFHIDIGYFHIFFDTIIQKNLEISFGTAIPNLSSQQINKTILPLPPLAEQQRIVAKVNELMAVCDKLEETQKKEKEKRLSLTHASLARLNEAGSNQKVFHKDVNFVIQNFGQLTKHSEQIKEIRKTILNLAVRGKLVPQDPHDESASELLKKIAKEKKKLIAEGKIKKEKILPDIAEEEKPFEMPKGWEWVRLGEVSKKIHYGYTASAEYRNEGIKLLRITDIQNSKVNWDTVPVCKIEKEIIIKYRLEKGDMLIARTGGTIGKSFLVNDIPSTSVFASYLIRLQSVQFIFNKYLKFFLDSPLYWEHIQVASRGTGQPNVNAQILSRLTLPLPPLAEQQRIVAKVNELMAVCDKLEASLREKERVSSDFLSSLLAEALG